MPAVNLPLQRTHGNVTLYPVPGTELRLLFIIILTSLGLAILGVALFVSRRRRRRRYKPLPPTYTDVPDAGPTALQRHWVLEKSHGIIFEESEIMSVSQPSGISQLRASENLGDGQKEHERDGAKEHENNGERLEQGMTTTASVGIDAGVFTFQDRRLSVAASTMGDLDTSFFHQPNPDYTLSPSSDSASTALAHGQDSPSIPRRRSYSKMLPLGSAHSDADHDGTSFSPSSFPSSSPILPLAPHESLESGEIDVRGEIISVMDDSGAGWKRHTRVYGGGVCLACLASGSEGGFYGDNVPPEHRR